MANKELSKENRGVLNTQGEGAGDKGFKKAKSLEKRDKRGERKEGKDKETKENNCKEK